MGWNTYVNRTRDAQAVVRAYQMFEKILADFAVAQVASFDFAAASQFELFRAQKHRLATLDLRIACIALSRDWVVLTRNLTDFRRVPGLRVEDWCS